MSKMKLFNFIRRIFTPKKFKQKILNQKFKKAPVADYGLWAKLKAEKAAKTAKEVESKDKDLYSRFLDTLDGDISIERTVGEKIHTVDLIS